MSTEVPEAGTQIWLHTKQRPWTFSPHGHGESPAGKCHGKGLPTPHPSLLW